MAKKKIEKKEKPLRKVYVADFETRVLGVDDLARLGMEVQDETEVWAAAWCECKEHPTYDDVTIKNNIYEFMDWLERLPDKALVGFFNLRFDGTFIVNELINEGFTPAVHIDIIEDELGPSEDDDEVVPAYGSTYEMYNQPYSYSVAVSNMGQWYRICIRFESTTVEIVDVAKVLSGMSLADVAKDFDTEHKKLEMEYEGDRRAFGAITPEECKYIANDVLVLSEGWWKARQLGLTKLTLGACALDEMKKVIGEQAFDIYFPDLTGIELPTGETCYEYIKRAYAGGLCWRKEEPDTVYVAKKNLLGDAFERYVKDTKNVKYVKNICVADVNSEYPFCLHSSPEWHLQNGGVHHYYPVYAPEYHVGEPTQEEIDNKCIFRRFKCHFDIKEKRIGFLHIRNDKYYNSHDCLESDRVFGERVKPNGESTLREYTMTQIDFETFNDTYNIEEYEAIDYLTFDREEGLFDDFLDMWIAKKIEGKKTGNKSLTTVSKKIVNSSYGKLSQGTCSSSKFIYQEDGVLKFKTHVEFNKKTVALAAGAYCTSYARQYILTAANAIYDNVKYIDTDSIHYVNLDHDELTHIFHDATALGAFDDEVKNGMIAHWVKQKTYIEIEKAVDKKTKEEYTNLILKAAGLSENGQKIVKKAFQLDRDFSGIAALYKNNSINDYECYTSFEDIPEKYKDEEGNLKKSPDYEVGKKFIDEFASGFAMPSINLKQKQVKNGVLLVSDDFSLN